MKNLLTILTIGLVLFGACKKEKADSEFTLGIGVYSYKQDTIDTKVLIDGKEHLKQDIVCANIAPNVREIKVTLQQGSHTIRVENLDRTFVFEKEVELTNEKMWGLVEFHKGDTSKSEKHDYSFHLSKDEMEHL